MTKRWPFVSLASEPAAPAGRGPTLDPCKPPVIDRGPYAPVEVWALFKGGEREADVAEAVVTGGARAMVAIELKMAEGLVALKRGERLPQVGHHLYDYGREKLDWSEPKARAMTLLFTRLRERPLLHEALRSGRVGLRSAQLVAPLAIGEAEAEWVDRAERETVRQLEQAVKAARPGYEPEPADPEPAFRLIARVTEEERQELDDALAIAGRLLPDANRAEQLEAMAQEFLGSFPAPEPRGSARLRAMNSGLDPAFVRIGPRPEDPRIALEEPGFAWRRGEGAQPEQSAPEPWRDGLVGPVPEIAPIDLRFEPEESAR